MSPSWLHQRLQRCHIAFILSPLISVSNAIVIIEVGSVGLYISPSGNEWNHQSFYNSICCLWFHQLWPHEYSKTISHNAKHVFNSSDLYSLRLNILRWIGKYFPGKIRRIFWSKWKAWTAAITCGTAILLPERFRMWQVQLVAKLLSQNRFCENTTIWLLIPVVLKLGSVVLLGSARQFSGDREATFKKSTRRSWRKKICVK